MTFVQVIFRLFLLICCIATITSFRIDHRPIEDRNERAVTEWRFRRNNYLLSLPYFYPNHLSDERLDGNEVVENENDNPSEAYEKKFIPAALYG